MSTQTQWIGPHVFREVVPARAVVGAEALPRDLLTGAEWRPSRLRDLYQLAADVKAHPERYRSSLAGRSVAMIFEKPSLRTRVTFEVGIRNLGGTPVFLDHSQSRLGEREEIQDLAKCLQCWVQGVVARTFDQSILEKLAEYAGIPVINALTDQYHPCQAMADFFTLEERFGNLRGLEMAYVGDGNNMCHSLMLAAARLGIQLRVATPARYRPDSKVTAEARSTARATGARIHLLTDPSAAVAGAQAVYTDVWVSMGQERESAERQKAFAGYQVTEGLMALAASGAVFMHCLPAHRGSEVAAGVIDSPQSIVYQQAENRLHVQNAIMLTLFG
ncbi:MAG TPA: ornithine carbamoyltransferase [Terriglobia bacterium]|nr:ornithine carbamoyltransferase [Terriglobia bacterium]